MNEKEEERVDKYKQVEKRLSDWDGSHRRATLSEMEAAIDRELAQLRREIIEEMVKARETERQGEEEACPNCGQMMAGNGQKKRKLKSKGGQEIQMEREQMRCTKCGMTLFPPGRDVGTAEWAVHTPGSGGDNALRQSAEFRGGNGGTGVTLGDRDK